MSQQPRRSIVKGAAWAAPAVLATATIPAYAASPQPALDGWLLNTTRCSSSTQMTYTINGQGTYPKRGLWVSGTTASAVIGVTKITQYVSTAAGSPVFQKGGIANEWSDLIYDPTAPVKTNYRAYTTTFNGTWRYDTATKLWFPSTLPYFTTSVNRCVRALQVITVRSVTVNGKVYSFERSGTLQPS